MVRWTRSIAYRFVGNAVLTAHPRCMKPGTLGVGTSSGLTRPPGGSAVAEGAREPLPSNKTQLWLPSSASCPASAASFSVVLCPPTKGRRAADGSLTRSGFLLVQRFAELPAWLGSPPAIYSPSPSVSQRSEL